MHDMIDVEEQNHTANSDPLKFVNTAGAMCELPEPHRVAVVGVACLFPGSPSVADLWFNIQAKRVQFRSLRPERLPKSAYYDADPSAVNKTHVPSAAYIDGFVFDRLLRRIQEQTELSTGLLSTIFPQCYIFSRRYSTLARFGICTGGYPRCRLHRSHTPKGEHWCNSREFTYRRANESGWD